MDAREAEIVNDQLLALQLPTVQTLLAMLDPKQLLNELLATQLDGKLFVQPQWQHLEQAVRFNWVVMSQQMDRQLFSWSLTIFLDRVPMRDDFIETERASSYSAGDDGHRNDGLSAIVAQSLAKMRFRSLKCVPENNELTGSDRSNSCIREMSNSQLQHQQDVPTKYQLVMKIVIQFAAVPASKVELKSHGEFAYILTANLVRFSREMQHMLVKDTGAYQSLDATIKYQGMRYDDNASGMRRRQTQSNVQRSSGSMNSALQSGSSSITSTSSYRSGFSGYSENDLGVLRSGRDAQRMSSRISVQSQLRNRIIRERPQMVRTASGTSLFRSESASMQRGDSSSTLNVQDFSNDAKQDYRLMDVAFAALGYEFESDKDLQKYLQAFYKYLSVLQRSTSISQQQRTVMLQMMHSFRYIRRPVDVLTFNGNAQSHGCPVNRSMANTAFDRMNFQKSYGLHFMLGRHAYCKVSKNFGESPLICLDLPLVDPAAVAVLNPPQFSAIMQPLNRQSVRVFKGLTALVRDRQLKQAQLDYSYCLMSLSGPVNQQCEQLLRRVRNLESRVGSESPSPPQSQMYAARRKQSSLATVHESGGSDLELAPTVAIRRLDNCVQAMLMLAIKCLLLVALIPIFAVAFDAVLIATQNYV